MPILKLSKAEREACTVAAVNGVLSGRYLNAQASADAHGANGQTVRDRLSGKRRPKSIAHQHQQRITPEAKQAIAKHCIYLAEAGFPCRIFTIKSMVKEAEKREAEAQGAAPD
jgi:hypothetical protein